MDNVKTFEDFLDRMQGLLDNAKKQGHIIVRVEDLENTFPELKESEDERMRNAAINACKYMVDNFENSTKQYEDAIAWLEKQGEQKPAWSEEDEKIFRSLLKALTRISSNTRTDSTSVNYSFFTEIEWIKSLKDRVQPQQEWSEEGEEMLEDVRFNFEYNKEKMTEALIAQYNRMIEKLIGLIPSKKEQLSFQQHEQAKRK